MTLVEEELHGLPRKYHAPFVLCCLEGRTQDEAARLLNWPAGTVRGRLARARAMLRNRLARRGLTLGSGGLAALHLESSATAAVPVALAESTLRAALAYSAGQAAAGRLASGEALALAEGALRHLFVPVWKIGLAVCLFLGVLGTAAGMMLQPALNNEELTAGAEAPPGTPLKPMKADKPALPADNGPAPADGIRRLGNMPLRLGNRLNSVTVSPDGKYLAASGNFGTLGLWELERRDHARSLKGHEGGWVRSVAFSPDSKLLASGGEDKMIRLWDAATGKEVRTFEGHGNFVVAVALSPDGQTLASYGHDNHLIIWNVATGKEIHVIKEQGNVLHCLAFSPDGKHVAAGGALLFRTTAPWGTIRLYDPATGKHVRTIDHRDAITSIDFSPDSKQLVSGGAWSAICLWDIETGKPVRTLQEPKKGNEGGGPVHRVAFAPDGKSVATTGFREAAIQIWDPATGKSGEPIVTNSADMMGLAFTRDGKTVISGGSDGRIRLWDMATRQEKAEVVGHPDQICAVAYAPDGKMVATGGGPTGGLIGDGRIILWDPATRKPLRFWKGHTRAVTTLTFSPDGKTLASGSWDDSIVLWDPATGAKIRFWPAQAHKVASLAFSPDGRQLACTGQNGSVRLWDPTTGKETRSLPGHKGIVDSVAFSPDGKTLVTGGFDQTVRLWDVATGKESHVLKPASGWNMSVTFAPDGNTLAWGGSDQSIRIWSLEGTKEVQKMTAYAHTVVFSPDGKLLVTATTAGSEPLIRVWEVLSGKEIRKLNGHQGAVRGLAFSPDGKTLLSGSEDTTVVLWDVYESLAPDRLRDAELTAEQMEQTWSDLASGDTPTAYQAIGTLMAVPKQTVPFLKIRLPHGPDEIRRIEEWIRDLDNDEFDRRQKASLELEKLGTRAASALREALKKTSSAEVQQRIEALLKKLPASERAQSTLAEMRLVQVLEQIGTPQARQLLDSLAKSQSTDVARDAKLALERLDRRR